MGAKLSALWNMISNQGQKSKSAGARNGTSSGPPLEKSSRLTKMETSEKTLALQDFILASPGLKPDYLLMRCDELCASKQSKKKVHPCSIRLRQSSISKATDSLCLDRPMNRQREGGVEGDITSNCSLIARNLCGKSQKSVSFKLPHTIMFYSPDKLYCEETSFGSLEEHKPYSSEDLFSSPNYTENTFESVDEPFFRLAVDILPKL